MFQPVSRPGCPPNSSNDQGRLEASRSTVGWMTARLPNVAKKSKSRDWQAIKDILNTQDEVWNWISPRIRDPFSSHGSAHQE